MKNNYSLFVLTIVLLISQFLLSQNLFNTYHMNLTEYNKMLNKQPDLDIDFIREKTQFFSLNNEALQKILNNQQSKLIIQIPFFNKAPLSINMNLFQINKQDIEIRRNTGHGVKTDYYSPNMLTYRIQDDVNNITGTFIFSQKGVKAVFNIEDQTYQVDLLNQTNNIYFMLKVQDSPIKLDFHCSHNILNQTQQEIDVQNLRQGNVFGCLDIALEIDYYTMQSFDNYQESIDWALEMLAVASSFYFVEIGVELTSSFIQTWEIADPYLDFIEEPNNMLFAIRDYWNNQEELSMIDRSLVHLLSKRDNTGTGGIAFLNGINSSWNGYGFSSNLTDIEEYAELPVPYFFWNIYCLMHELGHNFGAKHTQWCGWPSGPIDNCVNIEEMAAGECTGYTNDPEPQVGTIMSYCHMWTAQVGGGIIMKFHDIVKNTIIAYMGLQNLIDCNELDNVSIEEDVFTTNSEMVLYPNPANDYIRIKTDNLLVDSKSLTIINSIGQIVVQKANIDMDEEIDISSISKGRYMAYIITDSRIIKENIIIQ